MSEWISKFLFKIPVIRLLFLIFIILLIIDRSLNKIRLRWRKVFFIIFKLIKNLLAFREDTFLFDNFDLICAFKNHSTIVHILMLIIIFCFLYPGIKGDSVVKIIKPIMIKYIEGSVANMSELIKCSVVNK